MNKMLKITKDITGKKFNKLTVLGFFKYVKVGPKREARWECRCDCGQIRVTSARNLRWGHTKSCGCLKKEVGLKLRGKPGETGFNRLFSKYKFNAKARKRSFNLTKKYFKFLTSSNCHYCNKSPANSITTDIYQRCTSEAIENSKYTYNGIDRKNNNKGYTKENCVTCCENCNYLKGEFSYEKFTQLVKNISKHLGFNNELTIV